MMEIPSDRDSSDWTNHKFINFILDLRCISFRYVAGTRNHKRINKSIIFVLWWWILWWMWSCKMTNTKEPKTYVWDSDIEEIIAQLHIKYARQSVFQFTLANWLASPHSLQVYKNLVCYCISCTFSSYSSKSIKLIPHSKCFVYPLRPWMKNVWLRCANRRFGSEKIYNRNDQTTIPVQEQVPTTAIARC